MFDYRLFPHLVTWAVKSQILILYWLTQLAYCEFAVVFLRIWRFLIWFYRSSRGNAINNITPDRRTVFAFRISLCLKMISLRWMVMSLNESAGKCFFKFIEINDKIVVLFDGSFIELLLFFLNSHILFRWLLRMI